MCSLCSNWKYVITHLDNGLVPNRRQAIIWTNDLIYWRIYASLSLNELTHCGQMVYATYNWVNTGSGNGLSPDGTKQLTEPMLAYLRFKGMLMA